MDDTLVSKEGLKNLHCKSKKIFSISTWKDFLTNDELVHLKENKIETFDDLMNQYAHIRKYKTMFPGTHVCSMCEGIIDKIFKEIDG